MPSPWYCIFAFRHWNCPFSFRYRLMEIPAAAAPAGSFFTPLLLVCGTLVAAVLCAAHRLGLFYRLLHKVRGHRWEAGWGAVKEERGPGARDWSGDFLNRALPPLPSCT